MKIVETADWVRAAFKLMQSRALLIAHKCIAAAVIALCCAAATVNAIPMNERAFLLAFYTSTNGASWTNSSGWNGMAGTECTWAGITCSAGDANVIRINLPANNLVGSLPATLNDLTQLQTLSLSTNALGGAIPSFAGLTSLRSVGLHNNQFTGSLPALAGSTLLSFFTAYNNQLTGPIPALAGLTDLEYFYVQGNQLSGAIPSLAGLVKLNVFYVQDNQLTGTLPSLSGLGLLQVFYAWNNLLSGQIPAFTNQTSIQYYDVHDNQLTGSIPSLAALSALRAFHVEDNLLSGVVPGVPSPTSVLVANASRLCPNPLTPSVNTAWDTATGSTPWSVGCGEPFTVSQTPTLNLGVVGIGTPSAAQNVVLTNTSSAAGSVVSCAFSGLNASEFLYDSPAPVFPIALAVAQSVSIPLYALASSTGNKQASFSCVLSAYGTISGGPTALVADAPVPTVTQTGALAFNAVTQGVPSGNLNVVLTNGSAVTAQVTTCVIGGADAAEFAFNPAPNFPMFIGANASRNIAVQITATTLGAKTASVTCTPTAPSVLSGGPTAMTATANAPPISNISQSSALAFGSVLVGSSSAALSVSFINSVGANGAIASCTFGGANGAEFAFAPAPGFPILLASGQTINIPVSILATSVGPKTATLSCTAMAPGTLSGGPTTMTATAASISQTVSLGFGTVAVSVPSATQNVVLTNNVATSASIQTCAISGADALEFAFNPAPTFPIVLSANGGSASIQVRIVATSPGEKTAVVTCTPVSINDAITNPTQLAAATDRGCLDLDGDGQILAHTDLLMLSRAARNLTGNAVTNGAIIGTPPRNTWPLIRNYLNTRCNTNYGP